MMGAEDCAAAGCPCEGCAASWAPATTATPSTTATKIFFISMAPWIFREMADSGKRILLLFLTQQRLTPHSARTAFALILLWSAELPGRCPGGIVASSERQRLLDPY